MNIFSFFACFCYYNVYDDDIENFSIPIHISFYHVFHVFHVIFVDLQDVYEKIH